MRITLIDLAQANERLGTGEPAYEYQTDDRALRILGPACGFGPEYLQRLRIQGLYAETLEEAHGYARKRNVAVTGIWFVKQ